MFSGRDAIAGGTRLSPGSVYANIQVSSTRRGCLATLEKDLIYVQFRTWPLTDGSRVPLDEIRTTSGDTNKVLRRSWNASAPWLAGDKHFLPKQRDAVELSSQSSSTVSDTWRSGPSFFFVSPLAIP